MPCLPIRSHLAVLALALLPLALGCHQPQIGGFVCKSNGRDRIEQEVVYYAMEWAYDKVDFKICRNQKVLVEVKADTECDVPDIQECVARHIQAANGIVVDREANADLKLSSTINLVRFVKQERLERQAQARPRQGTLVIHRLACGRTSVPCLRRASAAARASGQGRGGV